MVTPNILFEQLGYENKQLFTVISVEKVAEIVVPKKFKFSNVIFEQLFILNAYDCTFPLMSFAVGSPQTDNFLVVAS